MEVAGLLLSRARFLCGWIWSFGEGLGLVKAHWCVGPRHAGGRGPVLRLSSYRAHCGVLGLVYPCW